MSYDTLLFVWDAFSFILFLVVLFAALNEKGSLKSNRKLLLISFSLFLGMFLFFREQYLLSEGTVVPVLTFFTYMSSAIAHMMITTVIVTLYTKVVLSSKVNMLIMLYGVVVGLIMTINIMIGSFVSYHFLLGTINAIPLVHLLVYVVKYDKRFYVNVFVFQIFALLTTYIIKTVNMFININTISFESVNKIDIGMLMTANVIIYSFIVSYLLISNSMIQQELETHKSVIEASLSNAIKLSELDPLTGLFNRRKIDEVIKGFKDLTNKDNTVFSIIMIDINGFKRINDEFGHNIGDDVLKFVAELLKSNLREVDIISRWDGDEFLVLLPNTPKDNANRVVNKINEFTKNNKCESINEFISLSFGIEDNLHLVNMDAILDSADKRMYEDKRIKQN